MNTVNPISANTGSGISVPGSSAAIAIFDTTGIIRHVSDKMCDLLHASANELSGANIKNIFHFDNPNTALSCGLQAIEKSTFGFITIDVGFISVKATAQTITLQVQQLNTP